jgi:hypothetical protein
MKKISYYRALIIVPPHGSWIIDQKKTWIIKSLFLRNIAQKPLLLVQGKQALGIISLDPPKEINLEKFRHTKNKHYISETERKKWWPNKRKLYVYRVASVHKFARPKKIDYPPGPQVLIKPENIF